MKKLLCSILALVAFVSFVDNASAQYNLYVTTLTGDTNVIAASTVRNLTNTIGVTRGANITLQATLTAVSSGATSNAVFIIDRSVDASNWELGAYTFFAAVNGTTATTTTTNINVGAFGYLRQRVFQNTNTVVLTNCTLKYAVKTGL